MADGAGKGKAVGIGNRIIGLDFGRFENEGVRDRQNLDAKLMHPAQHLHFLDFAEAPFGDIENFSEVDRAHQADASFPDAPIEDLCYGLRTSLVLEKGQQRVAVEKIALRHSLKSFRRSSRSSSEREGAAGRQPLASDTGFFDGGTK